MSCQTQNNSESEYNNNNKICSMIVLKLPYDFRNEFAQQVPYQEIYKKVEHCKNFKN